MKKRLILCAAVLLIPLWAWSQAAVTLDTALGNSAAYLKGRLPAKSKVVVLNFSSNWPQLSEYIIEEMIGHIVNAGNLTVVDRRNLEIIRQEIDFQLSGEVSDETAQSIGKKLGAQTVISGAITPIGNTYRLRVRAIAVETAEILGVQNVDVARDSRMADLTGTPAAATAAPMRRIAGTVPDFVRRAVGNVPADALVGIGTRKMGTISLSRTAATTLARSSISAQLITMVQNMIRDYTASSEVDPSATLLFHDNITVTLSISTLPGWTVVGEDTDTNGNYWVVGQLTKAGVIAEINQAVAAAKLAVPAMASFNADRTMNAALERACRAEIQVIDK